MPTSSLAALPLRDPRALAALALAAGAVVAVVALDLGPAIALGDDWVYAWAARHPGRLYPTQSAYALVQVLSAPWLTLGHTGPDALRLTELPYAGLAAVAAFRLAVRMGASTAWAVLAGLAPAVSPLVLPLTTSFMSDTVYFGLLLAAADGSAGLVTAAAAGRRAGRWARWGTPVLATLATAQRQVGVTIAPAVTLAVLLERRGRLRREDGGPLAAAWAGTGLALLLPIALHVVTPVQLTRLGAQRGFDLNLVGVPFNMLLPVAALMLAPFLPGLLRFLPRTPARLGALALLVGALLVVGWGFDHRTRFWRNTFDAGQVFPGGSYTTRGYLAEMTGLAGVKPDLLPTAAALVPDLLALATALCLLAAAARWRPVTWVTQDPTTRLLVVLAASQFVVAVSPAVWINDRYLDPALLLAAPIVAAAASRGASAPVTWAAIALTAAMGALAVASIQDEMAWNAAADRAAQLAYAQQPPALVHAGYTLNGVYLDIPMVESTGHPYPVEFVGGRLVGGIIDGPPGYVLRLSFAGPGAGGPGAGYRSIAPGRILVVPA